MLVVSCAFWLAILSRHIKHKKFSTKGVARLSYLAFIQIAFGYPLFAVVSIVFRIVVLEFVGNVVLFYVWVVLFLVFVFLPPILPVLKQKVCSHSYPRSVDANSVETYI